LGFVQLGLAVSLSMSKHETTHSDNRKEASKRVMRIACRFRCKRFVDNLQIRGRPMFKPAGSGASDCANEKRNRNKQSNQIFFISNHLMKRVKRPARAGMLYV